MNDSDKVYEDYNVKYNTFAAINLNLESNIVNELDDSSEPTLF